MIDWKLNIISGFVYMIGYLRGRRESNTQEPAASFVGEAAVYAIIFFVALVIIDIFIAGLKSL